MIVIVIGALRPFSAGYPLVGPWWFCHGGKTEMCQLRLAVDIRSRCLCSIWFGSPLFHSVVSLGLRLPHHRPGVLGTVVLSALYDVEFRSFDIGWTSLRCRLFGFDPRPTLDFFDFPWIRFSFSSKITGLFFPTRRPPNCKHGNC